MSRHFSSKIFHEPCPGDSRTRDLFPLPTLDGPGPVQGNVCRAVRRRIHKSNYDIQRVNMGPLQVWIHFSSEVASVSKAGALVTWPTCQTANVIPWDRLYRVSVLLEPHLQVQAVREPFRRFEQSATVTVSRRLAWGLCAIWHSISFHFLLVQWRELISLRHWRSLFEA